MIRKRERLEWYRKNRGEGKVGLPRRKRGKVGKCGEGCCYRRGRMVGLVGNVGVVGKG